MAKMKKKKSSFASVYANYAGPAAGTKVNFIKLKILKNLCASWQRWGKEWDATTFAR